MKSIYMVGSLRNGKMPEIANKLAAAGYDAFADWHAAGYEADDKWQEHEQSRGRTYREALYGYHARDVFEFDLTHINRCDFVVLILPCGKSGHLELGWALGRGKPGFVLFDKEPERWDVMYQFANAVCFSVDELLVELANHVELGKDVTNLARPGRA